MHFAGSMGWQIRSGDDRDLSLATYVRDVTGVGRYASAEPDLPPLEPAVPVQGVDVDLRDAIRQWETWWKRLLVPRDDDTPPFPAALDDLPVVRDLVERHTRGFEDWTTRAAAGDRTRHGSLHLTHFVNAYEHWLGRPVRPFHLHVREVSVAGSEGWVLAPDVVVISSNLKRDEAAFEAFLRPVIEALA